MAKESQQEKAQRGGEQRYVSGDFRPWIRDIPLREQLEGWMDPERANIFLRDGSEIELEESVITETGEVYTVVGSEVRYVGVLRADCLAWCLEELVFGYHGRVERDGENWAVIDA